MDETRTTWIEIKPEDMFPRLLRAAIYLGWFIVFFAAGLGLVLLSLYFKKTTTADGVWSMDPLALLIEAGLAISFAQLTIRKELRRWVPLERLGSRALIFNDEGLRCASCLLRNAVDGSQPAGDYLDIPWASIKFARFTRLYRHGEYLEISADQHWHAMLPGGLSPDKKQMIRYELKERGK